MNPRLCIIILLVQIALFSACSSDSVEGDNKSGSFSYNDLTEDFRRFRRTITGRHPLIFADKEELNAILDSVSGRIEGGLDSFAFFKLLAPAVAAVNCGHTHLNLSPAMYREINSVKIFFPFRIRIFSFFLYVAEDSVHENAIPPGSEILSINSSSAETIISRILPMLSSDGENQTGKIAQLNNSFPMLYCLFIDRPDAYEITWIPPEGGGVLESVFPAAYRQGNSSSSGAVEYNLSGDYAFLKVGSFVYYNRVPEFKAEMDAFFRTVNDGNIPNLILDLRNNAGGDPYCSSYLLRYLLWEPFRYFSGNTPGYGDLQKLLYPLDNNFEGPLFVLINGKSFSSTGHLLSLLQFYGRGTLIGEEAGGTFACTDSSIEVKLKNTGLILKCATRAFSTDVEGPDSWHAVKPDIEIEYAIDDYLAGRDLELQEAVRLVNGTN